MTACTAGIADALLDRRRAPGPCFVLAPTLLLFALNAAAGELPDRHLTPGTANSAVTEQDFRAQCHTQSWTRLYRPPMSLTNSLKRLQMKQYCYTGRDLRDFEEDHLFPLCLAGAPRDPANLGPQQRYGEWNADKKDKLETKLCRLACDSNVPRHEAQPRV